MICRRDAGRSPEPPSCCCMRQGQRLEYSSLGVMALVGDHGFGRCLSQEHVGSFEAVRLPWREMKSGGPVHPPPRESWRSARRGCVRWLAAPPFAPAPCWPVLAHSRDGRADHRVLVAGLLRQGFEDPLPYTPVAPAAVTQVRHLEVSETVAQRVSSGHGPSSGFSPAGFRPGT